jgi:hypothetical protein
MASLDTAWPVPPNWGAIWPLGKLGHFVVQVGSRIERWDLALHVRLEVISRRGENRRLLMDGNTLFLLGDRNILILSCHASVKKANMK